MIFSLPFSYYCSLPHSYLLLHLSFSFCLCLPFFPHGLFPSWPHLYFPLIPIFVSDIVSSLPFRPFSFIPSFVFDSTWAFYFLFPLLTKLTFSPSSTLTWFPSHPNTLLPCVTHPLRFLLFYSLLHYLFTSPKLFLSPKLAQWTFFPFFPPSSNPSFQYLSFCHSPDFFYLALLAPSPSPPHLSIFAYLSSSIHHPFPLSFPYVPSPCMALSLTPLMSLAHPIIGSFTFSPSQHVVSLPFPSLPFTCIPFPYVHNVPLIAFPSLPLPCISLFIFVPFCSSFPFFFLSFPSSFFSLLISYHPSSLLSIIPFVSSHSRLHHFTLLFPSFTYSSLYPYLTFPSNFLILYSFLVFLLFISFS